MKKAYFLIVIVFFLWGCVTIPQTQQNNKKEKAIAYIYYEMARNIILHRDYANLSKAFIYLKKSENINPKDPKIFYMKALAYKIRNNSHAFLYNIRKTLRIDPHFYDALNALGIYYAQQKQYNKALNIFTKLIDDPLYQNTYSAFFNRALIYEKDGKIKKALDNLHSAIIFTDYHNKIFWRYLISLDMNKKMYVEALNDLYSMSIHLGNSNYTYYNMAVCYAKLNMFNNALAMLNKIKNKKSIYYIRKNKLIKKIKHDSNTHN